MEFNIPTWQILLFVYLVFGLAPTMTLLTGLVVGHLYGRAYLGWVWGLGTALISSPAGLVTIMMTAPALRDKDENLWTFLLYVGPFVITGLLFSAIAALIISKRAEGRR